MISHRNSVFFVRQQTQDADLRVDYVQIRRLAEETDVKALVFPAATALASRVEGHVRVSIKVDTKKQAITESVCDRCLGKGR